MIGDYMPFTKLVAPSKGDKFWITRVHTVYYPYKTRHNMIFGIVSPSLMNTYSQEELKELYDNAPAMSNFV